MYAADLQHENAGLEHKLRRIYELRGSKPGIDLSIRAAYLNLLKAIGNPHKHLPPTIHVAGTNGKGSTIAMMRAILETAGYSVHTYTSPQLYRFNERIVLAGQIISDHDLADLIDDILGAAEDSDLTFFETTTAMAFRAFAAQDADILLLETGMGGRLDCTNVIESPLATVITRIDYDHVEYLGHSLEKIAAEKAGIFKSGCRAFTTGQDNKALQVLKERANALDIPLHVAPSFQYTGTATLALTGPHQLENAALAAGTIRALPGFDITDADILTGLETAKWPGRLQHYPPPAPGWELWFDGAHNNCAAKALARQAEAWQAQDSLPLHLIVGMMQSKDAQAFIRTLGPCIESVYTVHKPEEPGFYSPESLARRIKKEIVVPVVTGYTVQTALQKIIANERPGRILVCGSLYLASEL